MSCQDRIAQVIEALKACLVLVALTQRLSFIESLNDLIGLATQASDPFSTRPSFVFSALTPVIRCMLILISNDLIGYACGGAYTPL